MRQSHRALRREIWLHAALVEIPGAVTYRSRYVADLLGTKFFANRNVPNCSIAFADKAYSRSPTE
jgi:hypothetical protein